VPVTGTRYTMYLLLVYIACVFCLQKETKGEELFDSVCAQLNLLEKHYFGLQYTDDKRQRVFFHR